MSKKFFFTPGPTQLYPGVELFIRKALSENVLSISHRSSAFKSIFKETTEGLRNLLKLPDHYHIAFTGSATEIWERLLQNLVTKSSLHFVNGSFSKRFFDISNALGFQALHLTVGDGQPFDLDAIEPDEAVELIAITQNETSIGFNFPAEAINKLRNRYPEKVLAVDCVSSLPGVALDFSAIDTAYLSVQKCFGLPAGLGVWFFNDRCRNLAEEKISKGFSVGSYHSIPSLVKSGSKNQTPETPNVLAIFLLNEVVKDMLNRGLENIQKETNAKSAILYQLINELDSLEPFIKEKNNRSKTVIVADVQNESEALIDHLSNNSLIIGSGYGQYKSKHIRVANFPAHSKEQIEFLVDEIKRYQN